MWNGRNKDVERLLKLRGQQCPFSDEVCTKVRNLTSGHLTSDKPKYSGFDANIKVFEENRAKQNRPIFQNGK